MKNTSSHTVRVIFHGNVARLLPVVLWCLIVCFSGCDAPQSATVSDKVGRHESDNAKSRERDEFDRLLSKWRGTVAELSQLNVECRVFGTRNAAEARGKYAELVKQGEDLQSQLIAAATLAYAKRPADNKDLVQFLLMIANMEIQREQYEIGLRILQALIDNGVTASGIFSLAVQTATKANEFKLAEKFCAMQQKANLDTGDLDFSDKRAFANHYAGLWSQEKKLRDAELAAADLPRVKLQTNKGEIELELFENEAPNTVANFLSLVEKGFYDGLPFYRVTSGEEAYAGCPNGDGTGGPGYRIASECSGATLRRHFRGSISMVSADASPGSSQFFLCLTPRGMYDGRHTVFGRVVWGIEVLADLQRRVPRDKMSTAINPHSNVVIPPADRIISATVIRKRPHPYKPEIGP
ncbi:MAG: peptidylprolyl isomerase [Thermoguttaceae bacterium]